MSKTYGVVLIGCGHIGEAHIEDIYYRDEIRIVGVVDLYEENAKLFARKYGAEHYATDYHEMIQRDDVDIVIIATYARTHLEILKECVAAGKHVLCEKPMTQADMAAAKEFYHVVKAAKTKVLIAHVLRHNDTYTKVKNMIRDGAIGEVRFIRMVQNHHIMNPKRYGALLEDCPPIVDCGVHYIDVIRWFTGLEITSVGGLGTTIDHHENETGEFDHGILTMKLSNGGSAYYEAGWANNLAAQNLKEFIGDQGRIRITLQENRAQDAEEGDLIEYYTHGNATYTTINNKSKYKNMWGQLQTLIEMIETGEEGNPSFDEAFEAFMIALVGNEAAKQNKVIELNYKWEEEFK
ncbi:MAG: Gfo/Idh/MocA family oxidoreductase [Lachnospiraceae bacterium]|jgi:predicted dehydrogenase|nr:Gfo/Idh/MocA family oxidoreductase [Lachnospiraceae bacterium]